MNYRPQDFEAHWRAYWEQQNVYRVTENPQHPKYYVLDMFPYPSGEGLHVGHPLGYVASDIIARFKRLQGYNVLHPMGFDAFGLPAEQYAIQTGIHPATSTQRNLKRYREQLDILGFSFDWSRTVATCDPAYYHWTQYLFLLLFEHYYDTSLQRPRPIQQLIFHFEQQGTQGVTAATDTEFTFTALQWQQMTDRQKSDILMNYRLAYRKVGYVNWCEALGSVLANDEVVNGVSERGGYPVVRREMMQWALRITAYAERLLADLDTLDWPEAIKTHQRNWIGRSEGARIWFQLQHTPEHHLEVFTTRPDTIFGATFMVLAPEHPLVAAITTPAQQAEITRYLQYVNSRSERERQVEVKTVTGAFTGAFALHPFTGLPLPIWISEYVLIGYGTGAIMAVPSNDERDQRFAQHFDLPIIPVVDQSAFPTAHIGDKVGHLINSDFLNHLPVPQAIAEAITAIETRGIGKRQVNYKLRDANFSRQRYWGEPIPIKYDAQGVAHPETNLPLELPPLDNFKPTADGQSPLARLHHWVHTPDGFTRETDTMPGFAGSSWYWLRYMDPNNPNAPFSPESVAYWRDVDLYIGGSEHAVGHLLYARLWHKILFDLSLVPTPEPFRKLVNQGMIQGRSLFLTLRDGRRLHIPVMLADRDDRLHYDRLVELKLRDNRFDNLDPDTDFDWHTDPHNAQRYLQLEPEIEKMSKSRLNVVNPDHLIAEYGADTFRMYEMFLGPLEQSKPWNTAGISGVQSFLRKLWSLYWPPAPTPTEQPTLDERRIMHQCIKRVTTDLERLSLNTCVSHFMIAVNELKKLPALSRTTLEQLVVLIAPFAPFTAEELWQRALHHTTSVHTSRYPIHDESVLLDTTIEYPIAINGKTRLTHTFDAQATTAQLEAEALALEVVQKWLAGATPKRVIVVPRRMINIVL